MDPDIKTLIQILIEGQTRTDHSINELVGAVDRFVDASDKRAAELHAAQLHTEAAIARYVDASDARMKRLEENLDGLIRAITREHSNGKGKAS